jgi:hypothetical protein
MVVVNRSTAGHLEKMLNASRTGKPELHNLPQATLPQLLVLKCCGMQRPLFARIDVSTQQLALSLSISKGRVGHII